MDGIKSLKKKIIEKKEEITKTYYPIEIQPQIRQNKNEIISEIKH